MKRALIVGLMASVSFGLADAQSANKMSDAKEKSPGTTGAMQESGANGVARDSNEVKKQQGKSAKSSPGTVGAAPGADTPSQKPGR